MAHSSGIKRGGRRGIDVSVGGARPPMVPSCIAEPNDKRYKPHRRARGRKEGFSNPFVTVRATSSRTLRYVLD
jgi:hypothetical protein